MDRPLFGLQELRLLNAKKQVCYYAILCKYRSEQASMYIWFVFLFVFLPVCLPTSLSPCPPGYLSPGRPVSLLVCFVEFSGDSVHRNDTLICHLIIPMHPGWDGVGRWNHPCLPNTFANQMDHWLASTLSQRSDQRGVMSCFESVVSSAMLAVSCRPWG